MHWWSQNCICSCHYLPSRILLLTLHHLECTRSVLSFKSALCHTSQQVACYQHWRIQVHMSLLSLSWVTFSLFSDYYRISGYLSQLRSVFQYSPRRILILLTCESYWGSPFFLWIEASMFHSRGKLLSHKEPWHHYSEFLVSARLLLDLWRAFEYPNRSATRNQIFLFPSNCITEVTFLVLESSIIAVNQMNWLL